MILYRPWEESFYDLTMMLSRIGEMYSIKPEEFAYGDGWTLERISHTEHKNKLQWKITIHSDSELATYYALKWGGE